MEYEDSSSNDGLRQYVHFTSVYVRSVYVTLRRSGGGGVG